MSKTKTTSSPALTFIRHAWDSTSRGSWDCLNGTMYGTLRIAIDAGMRFDEGDFAVMASEMNMGRWCSDLEWAYTAACGGERGTDNASAVHALEKYLKREPFLWAEKTRTPKRLHVGAELTWKGERVKITSFKDTKKSLVACAYKKASLSYGEEDTVGSTSYLSGNYRRIEAVAKLPDDCLAIRYSAPIEYKRDTPTRIFVITVDELKFVRKEYDTLRRMHEKAIAVATTLDELESARVAAAVPGSAAYRHFDIEILTEAIKSRKTEIEKFTSEADRAAYEQKVYANLAVNLERWVAGEDVRDYLHSDIRVRIKGGYVETSNGHRVSIDAARSALAFVVRHRSKGWQSNGQTFNIDAFPLTDIATSGVQVGCTLIPWNEVDRCRDLLKAI